MTTTDIFEQAVNFTLVEEGGYVNDPQDPGGETNFGISKRAYPNEDIRNMTRERAVEIYRRAYWDNIRGDELPPKLAFVTFDAAVNSGPGRAVQWLQLATASTPDGLIGPKTLAAVQSAAPNAYIEAVAQRILYLSNLNGWHRYGLGWTRRCARLLVAVGGV